MFLADKIKNTKPDVFFADPFFSDLLLAKYVDAPTLMQIFYLPENIMQWFMA